VEVLRDIVIVIPGITGSVLCKDGTDVWAPSRSALFQGLRTWGQSIRDLELGPDSADLDDLNDGITAPRMIPDAHIVPGLVKIDGYSRLVREISDGFDGVTTVREAGPANLFEFPYDWRRDNRVAARRLKRLVDSRLSEWREKKGGKGARVILVAHSMGGLVARYYLEVLEGWQDCRALVTFGTPYRGSLNALDYLANGYKQYFLDLTEVMRTFTSLYQLLPIYPVVAGSGSEKRVHEVSIDGVCPTKAKAAWDFHDEIRRKVEEHQNLDEYRKSGYIVVPYVGHSQPTLQSAHLAGSRVTVGRSLPSIVPQALDGGDGTVPRCSATPIELTEQFRETFFAERHGSLQAHPDVISDLIRRLEQMQIGELWRSIQVPAAVDSVETRQRPALALDLADLYYTDKPILLKVRTIAAPREGLPPNASIERLDRCGTAPLQYRFDADGQEWSLAVPALDAGLYRVRVSADAVAGPSAVHDLFEVADRDSH
jgi:Lecithin:cholesterol acyltransferase